MIPARTLRSLGSLSLRWLAIVSLAVWFGGFTFYSAVVVPVLGEVMGKVESGSMVTREVTVTLNQIGVGTLAVWWVLSALERNAGGVWRARLRWGCLAVNSGLLVWLFVLHGVLGQQLDEGSMTGFYARHEFYLILSTVQWTLNLALVGLTLRIWRAIDAASGGDLAA
ncbi:MAG: DUF4149 domain-containing protein [Isosphaeraceae bacterium]